MSVQSGFETRVETRPSMLSPDSHAVKRVRRKESFIGRIDSSEDPPSSHESIIEAEYLSASDSEDAPHKAELRYARQSFRIVSPLGNISNSVKPSPLPSPPRGLDRAAPLGETPILYGHGTALTTITEQNSKSTMRTRETSGGYSIPKPRSSPDLQSVILASHPHLLNMSQESIPLVIRRRASFSEYDLRSISNSYHNAVCVIEGTIQRPVSVHAEYAGPLAPVTTPVERPGTPPGLPSWTAAQSTPTSRQHHGWIVHQTPSRLQRFFGLDPPSIELSGRLAQPPPQYDAHTPLLITPRSSSQQRGRRDIAPRFHAHRSAHGGALESHPFSTAGIAEPGGKSESLVAGPPAPGFTFIPVMTGADGPHLSLVTDAARCPHRTGRRPALRYLRRADSNFASSLRTSRSNITSRRTVSYSALPASQQPMSSGRPTITGAIHLDTPPLPESGGMPMLNHSETIEKARDKCWKCCVGDVLDKVDEIWEKGAVWCCWMCCGVDLSDESTHQIETNERGMRRVMVDGVPVII